MEYSPPGSSSVHGISQAAIPEPVASSFSRGSSWTRDEPTFPALAGGFLTTEPPGKPPRQGEWEVTVLNTARSEGLGKMTLGKKKKNPKGGRHAELSACGGRAFPLADGHRGLKRQRTKLFPIQQGDYCSRSRGSEGRVAGVGDREMVGGGTDDAGMCRPFSNLWFALWNGKPWGSLEQRLTWCEIC